MPRGERHQQLPVTFRLRTDAGDAGRSNLRSNARPASATSGVTYSPQLVVHPSPTGGRRTGCAQTTVLGGMLALSTVPSGTGLHPNLWSKIYCVISRLRTNQHVHRRLSHPLPTPAHLGAVVVLALARVNKPWGGGGGCVGGGVGGVGWGGGGGVGGGGGGGGVGGVGGGGGGVGGPILRDS
jgi:hypothetical protein